MGSNGDNYLVIILGLGFTGKYLARRLLRRGAKVCALVRGVNRFPDLAEEGLQLSEFGSPGALPKHSVVADLIPPLPTEENVALRAIIEQLEPRRIVYVSSTGVYGDQVDVDVNTPATPNDERGRRRLEEERWISAGPWSSLILRAAAIYGPGRGVHAAFLQGKVPRSAGSGIVSRIHVEDLAAIVEAGIFSDLQGCWPVADEDPCTSAEIAKWCAEVLKLDNKMSIAEGATTGRRVEGKKIFELVGVQLTHRSWRTGVPASLASADDGRIC
jgi:nucleoside-diphosphate-sugar epimerase